MSEARTRRVTAIAALAVTASSGIAIAAAASPAAAGTPSPTPVASNGYNLSIALGQKSIDRGASDTVSGTLTEAGTAQAGDTVYLHARTNGRHHHVHRVGSGTTDANGNVSFTVTPKVNTHYRLVFRLAPTVTPTPTATPVPTPVTARSVVVARSRVATVHILRDASMSIRARERHNGHWVVQGQLRGRGHGLAHRKVEVQERTVGSNAWSTVATKRTHRHGVVQYRLAAPTGAEEFQLVFAGGSNFHGCQSGVVTVGG